MDLPDLRGEWDALIAATALVPWHDLLDRKRWGLSSDRRAGDACLGRAVSWSDAVS